MNHCFMYKCEELHCQNHFYSKDAKIKLEFVHADNIQLLNVILSLRLPAG